MRIWETRSYSATFEAHATAWSRRAVKLINSIRIHTTTTPYHGSPICWCEARSSNTPDSSGDETFRAALLDAMLFSIKAEMQLCVQARRMGELLRWPEREGLRSRSDHAGAPVDEWMGAAVEKACSPCHTFS